MTENDLGKSGESRRSRPVTAESYGIPESDDGLLSWAFVAERMAADRSYWVTTVRPDGIPHARPNVVFAWSDYPTDATRWEFADE